MFESDDEIRELDDLFARTYARANPSIEPVWREISSRRPSPE
jgi:hypothetical protein